MAIHEDERAPLDTILQITPRLSPDEEQERRKEPLSTISAVRRSTHKSSSRSLQAAAALSAIPPWSLTSKFSNSLQCYNTTLAWRFLARDLVFLNNYHLILEPAQRRIARNLRAALFATVVSNLAYAAGPLSEAFHDAPSQQQRYSGSNAGNASCARLLK